MEITDNAPPDIAAKLIEARAALLELGVLPDVAGLSVEAGGAVGALTQDADLSIATALHWAQHEQSLRDGPVPATEQLNRRFGATCVRLAAGLMRLGELRLPAGWSASQGLNAQQAETLRNMLLALASDPRLVLARLAEQLVRLRHARTVPLEAALQLAVESREIFAPLANRLGVWNLKWEIEDLAFRYLQSTEYYRIAVALAERRVDRERYIEQICALLGHELQQAGVSARVYGRPKHIYSIWRKMQRKQVDFDEVFDVRAVRIVVENVADCYAALGIVHGRWRYMPGEFDDYIAQPKGNAYRSIHTAVIGPEDKAIEVQIRTRDMDEHAELGVAAHWRYKEGGARDISYERKIEWVRRLLDPARVAEAEGDFIETVKAELFTDRIYAMTPRGEVVDLPRGATPLDFAYHLHTDLGHRCRGAKIDGRIVPLNQPLANGEVVEIIAAKSGAPSRDWLSVDQGFLASPRSRAKVRAWFRRLDETDHHGAGRAILERELARAAAGPEILAALVSELGADGAEHLQRQLGEGAISAAALGAAIRNLRPVEAAALVTRKRPHSRAARSPVDIEGVGDLPTTMARCCGPVPPESISGYLTLGRGVTIHRERCANLARMRAINPQRVLRVEWNLNTDSLMPVSIRIEAFDRRGLLRDVSDVMALERLSIDGVNSNTDPDDRIATIVMRTAVHDTEQLGRVLKQLVGVPNVLRAERVT